MSVNQNVGSEGRPLYNLAKTITEQADREVRSLHGLLDRGENAEPPASARIDTVEQLQRGVDVLAKDKRIAATDEEVAEADEKGYRTHTVFVKMRAAGFIGKVTQVGWMNCLWAQITHEINSHAARMANGKWKMAGLHFKSIWIDVKAPSRYAYGDASAAREQALAFLPTSDGGAGASPEPLVKKPVRHLFLTIVLVDVTGAGQFQYDSKTGEPIQGTDRKVEVHVAPVIQAAPAVDPELEVAKARVEAERREMAELRRQMQQQMAELRAQVAASAKPADEPEAKPKRRGRKPAETSTPE